MHLKNGKKLYNESGITFFHKTERYVKNLNIYNRSKNGTNLWDDLIYSLRINEFSAWLDCTSELTILRIKMLGKRYKLNKNNFKELV